MRVRTHANCAAGWLLGFGMLVGPARSADPALPAPGDPCRAYVVVLEFVVGPAGRLERLQFTQPIDCRKNPANPPISEAWKKTACVSVVLDHPGPTYREGEASKPMYTFKIFDADRPDFVLGPPLNMPSRTRRAIAVRDGILDERGSELDGSSICDQPFEYVPPPPTAGQGRGSPGR